MADGPRLLHNLLNRPAPSRCTAAAACSVCGVTQTEYASWANNFRQAAQLVDRILKGTQPPDLPVEQPANEMELSQTLCSAGLSGVVVRAFSVRHRLNSPEELWNGILGGTVRTSIGIRRQPKAMPDRIRGVFERLVQSYVVDGGISVPVAFTIASGQRRGLPNNGIELTAQRAAAHTSARAVIVGGSAAT